MDFLMAIDWSISPEIFKLGPFSIRWYGLLFALAFILDYQIMAWVFKKENKDIRVLEGLTVAVILGTVIGARLGHCLFYEPAYYLANPLRILEVWKGGLASHGGALGILIAVWIFVKRQNNKIDFVWTLDRLAIPIAITSVLIRLGNLMNSEIIGRQADVPWAFIFTSVDLVPRHPSQLYEALAYLITFLFLSFRYIKLKGIIPSGSQLGYALILIFSSRIFLEYFKENQAAFENGMAWNMGQLLSLPFIAFGVFLVIKGKDLKIR
jgi:prolipoprotein diacylglyceryl transferase